MREAETAGSVGRFENLRAPGRRDEAKASLFQLSFKFVGLHLISS
jgi:hypothetical protein